MCGVAWLTSALPEIEYWLMLGVGALCGLVAAYARELHDDGHPDRRWWLLRLAIAPLLMVAAAAADDRLSMSDHVALFVSGALTLLGFDALRVISSETRRRLSGKVVEVFAPPDSKTSIPPKGPRVEVVSVGDTTPQTPGQVLIREFRDRPLAKSPELDGLIDKLDRKP